MTHAQRRDTFTMSTMWMSHGEIKRTTQHQNHVHKRDNVTLKWCPKLSCECGCGGNEPCSENHRFHQPTAFGECKDADVALTWIDVDRHGSLLNDGSDPWEGGEAAVVTPAVLFHRMRKVKVSVQAHGHPLVLLDVPQICRQNFVLT